MASVVGNNKVKLNNGQTVSPQPGEWYDGQQFWNGSLGPPGVIINPNQQGSGQAVSSEVVRQTNPANVDYLKGLGGAAGQIGGGAPVSPLEAVNQQIQNSFQKLKDEVVKRFGEYRAGKPFRIDEVLAEKGAEAAEQIDPYYNQILSDYMTGVTRKIQRGESDTRDLLSELSATTTSYNEEAQNTLASAVEQAQQGFAESGLFQSGEQLSAEGQAKQKVGANLQDYQRKAAFKEKELGTGLTRNLEDIGLEKKDYVTRLERERFTETENRKSQLAKESGQQYVQGFQSTLPTELQSASGFDMLKSLGIYG